MKHNLSLYIADRRVDLDEQTLIQFTYTAEDLSNPSVVKNSYSQQVKIEGTRANNAIFGAIYRLDRKTVRGSGSGGVGIAFDPLVKTPFVIYAGSRIIERGYMKLDKIERKGADVTYVVTLYGGLGSFFYALSYDDAGEKKNLASLDYGLPEKIDFRITASVVKTAWSKLNEHDTRSKWSIINFAPAYNGIPKGEFSADKAIFRPDVAGLQSTVTRDGVTYKTTDGWSLVSLENEYTEWETKDLRSYLQRPVISLRGIIAACADPKNNGGHTVELDPHFFNEKNPYYADLWMALPLLNSYDMRRSEGRIQLTWDEEDIDEVDLQIEQIGALEGTTSTISISLKPKVEGPYETGTILSLGRYKEQPDDLDNFIRYRVILYDRQGTTIQQSGWIAFSSGRTDSGASSTITGQFVMGNSNVGTWQGAAATFTFTEVESVYQIRIERQNVWEGIVNTLYLRQRFDDYAPAPIWGFMTQRVEGYAEYKTYLNARSGSLIKQSELLATDHTPADYLLSYCKLFGLGFIYDKEEKRVRIVLRNTTYGVETIDLTERIDRSKNIEIKPFLFDQKWYDFNVEQEESEYINYYQELYGRSYGIRRINTGYDFNADSKDVLSGNAFKGTAEVLEREKYFININQGGRPYPAPFVDAGHKYALYSSSGDVLELDVPTASADALITYFNDVYRGYDAVSKAQFHEEENGAIDSNGVLLLYRGMNSDAAYGDFMLTDDVPAMGKLNDATPCWMLNGGSKVDELPMFGRYIFEGSTIVKSLDFGTPAEIDIPEVSTADGATLYDQYWRMYIEDRYDVDTKIVKCYVNLDGIRVGDHLLRNFYYFDGSLFVLNKISNYALTSSDTVQCEFVKVNEKEAYTSGQASYDRKFTVTPNELVFPYSTPDGMTKTVVIESDAPWRIGSYNDNNINLKVSPLSGGVGETTISVFSPDGAAIPLPRLVVVPITSWDDEITLILQRKE